MRRTNGYFKNSDDSEKHSEIVKFDINENAIKVINDTTIMFSKPVVITDNSEMWSGAKYDIPSLDISGYKGKLTADHIDRIQNVLGSVIGVKKVANRKVTIDGIKFASQENPLADFAQRMMLAGHLTDFSIETIGPWPDDDGIFKNAKLVGLSLVVTGNNKQAHINDLAKETVARAKENGIDYAAFANAMKLPIDNKNDIDDNNIMKFKSVKNSRSFAITLKYKNSVGAETEVILKAGQAVDVPDNDENKGTEAQVTDATEPKPADAPKDEPKDTPTDQPKDAPKDAPQADQSLAKAVQSLTDQMTQLQKNLFDNGVQEPVFGKPFAINSGKAAGELEGMDYKQRHGLQINYAWDMLKSRDMEAGKKLNEINKFHFEKLQEKGIAKNTMTMSDFGNMVISPELLGDIEGFRSDFKPLLNVVGFQDTLSLQMGWLKRNGDINMQELDSMCDDGEDGNLKPITEYDTTFQTSNLKEVAGVTPVCDAATRFLAADMLGDISKGYRTDYDRKLAQLVVARLQQAVNSGGHVAHYNTNSTGGADKNALASLFAIGGMQEEIIGGVYIMSQASFWEIAGRRFSAGINTDDAMQLFTKGPNGETMLLGARLVVVPNELLPKLGSSQTRTFYVDGQQVTITSAVFYFDPSTFTGRTSGGLKYDLSTEAAYEVNGVVKSSFQRDELLVRGAFFRGGAVKDDDMVVGLEAVNLS